jgi:hypothetical protein
VRSIVMENGLAVRPRENPKRQTSNAKKIPIPKDRVSSSWFEISLGFGLWRL